MPEFASSSRPALYLVRIYIRIEFTSNLYLNNISTISASFPIYGSKPSPVTYRALIRLRKSLAQSYRRRPNRFHDSNITHSPKLPEIILEIATLTLNNYVSLSLSLHPQFTSFLRIFLYSKYLSYQCVNISCLYKKWERFPQNNPEKQNNSRTAPDILPS